MSTKDIINKQLADNPVILYMKGLPSAPECGFSAKAVDILNSTQIPFAFVDVLKAPFIREKLPSISRWPTYPQLFVNGQLLGGADIIEAMHKNGSLLPILQAAVTNDTVETQQSKLAHREVEALILQSCPDAEILITGEGCNLSITVISSQFDGQSLVQQHQTVMTSLNEFLTDGRLHAVSLKTFIPEQWRAQRVSGNSGLLQIQL